MSDEPVDDATQAPSDADPGSEVSKERSTPSTGEPTAPTEGVRIIGATEAGDAMGAREGSRPDSAVERRAPVTPAETFELPHYSGPPTGQVPKVVIGEGTEASWAGLGDAPRWRDTEQHFDEQRPFTDMVADESSAANLDKASAEPTRPAEMSRSGETHEVSANEAVAVAPDEVGSDRTAEPTDLSEPERPPATVFDASIDLTGEDAPTVSVDNDDEGAAPVLRRPPSPRRRPRAETPADTTASGAATRSGRNLPVAIGVGVALAGVAVICFVLGSIVATVLITVVLTVAGIELFTTLQRAGYQPASFLAMAAIIGLAIAPLYRGWFAYPVIFGLVTIATLAWFLFVQTGEGAVMNAGVTMLGVAYVGLGSFATLLLGIARPYEGSASNQGIGIVFAAIMVTVANDVGAYFIGKRFGRTPLNAASPNKTQEGLLGGFLTAIVLPLAIIEIVSLQPIDASFWKAFAFCLICAVMAPIGDLAESAIKRDLKVKDMGTLLPGHGGMLDRIDGLLFVLPTAYFMAHLLGLGRPAFF